MDQFFTHYTDLGGVTLSDGSDAVWVHALPMGEYKHPIHGKLSFTAERIKRFAASVRGKVLGVDPDIDYDHKLDPAHGKKAAGWVKDAEDRPNGLWLLVEFTDTARQMIKNKEYRYFSAEYVDEMEDAQGNKFVDVVRGGGLTNRPFMKNLVPINLSELGAEEIPPSKENEMDRKKLAKLLGLGEDATDEQVEAALNAKSAKLDLSKAEVTVSDDGTIEVKHPEAEGVVTHKVEPPAPKAETEPKVEDAIAELEKTNPQAAAMLREQANETKQLSEEVKTLVATQRLNDVNVQLSEVGKGDKKALAPAVIGELAPLMVRLPKQLSDEFVAVLSKLTGDSGIVQLGEVAPTGAGGNGDGESYNPVKKFYEAVEAKRIENDKLSFSEGVSEVQLSDPELFEDYKSAVAQGVTLSD
jgi:hypothetical protein